MVERIPMTSEQIYFVSVGRVRDQTMLATCKTSNYIKSDQFKYNAADEVPAQTHQFRYQSNANSDGSDDLK